MIQNIIDIFRRKPRFVDPNTREMISQDRISQYTITDIEDTKIFKYFEDYDECFKDTIKTKKRYGYKLSTFGNILKKVFNRNISTEDTI